MKAPLSIALAALLAFPAISQTTNAPTRIEPQGVFLIAFLVACTCTATAAIIYIHAKNAHESGYVSVVLWRSWDRTVWTPIATNLNVYLPKEMKKVQLFEDEKLADNNAGAFYTARLLGENPNQTP